MGSLCERKHKCHLAFWNRFSTQTCRYHIEVPPCHILLLKKIVNCLRKNMQDI